MVLVLASLTGNCLTALARPHRTDLDRAFGTYDDGKRYEEGRQRRAAAAAAGAAGDKKAK